MRSRPTPSPRLAAVTLLAAIAAGGSVGAGEPAPPPQAGKVEPAAPPITWLPWSAQVFERARKESRGVLLTVVSRWCRACVAADDEVYDDPGVRKAVSLHWLPVRVDRDERPDIETRYQLASSSFTHGKTGLPVTAFLFPTGESMWADTFIPLEDGEKHPGLRNLLYSSDNLWHARFPEARKNAQFIQVAFDLEKNPIRDVTLSPEFLSALMDATIVRADHEHGGFGEAPRIANPYDAEIVLLAAMRRRDDGLRRLADEALKAAISGASYDRIGGGFHRVARDESWSVATWDKPLGVNAAYLTAMIEAMRASKDDRFAAPAGATVDFILRTLAAPGGGFYFEQSPSADRIDEAAFYTWKIDEVKAALKADDLKWARALFGLRDEGEVLLGLPPRFTLKQALSEDEAAATAGLKVEDLRETARRITSALAAARSKHAAPPVLEARYLDSTSLAASALLQAGAFLDRQDATAPALKAIDQVLAANEDPGRGIRHRLDAGSAEPSPILMPDQVYFGTALLDAHEITGENRYLEAAKKVAGGMKALFLDGDQGGFYDVIADESAPGYLRLRRKPMIDGATPSPAASAARFLLRLAALTGDDSFRVMAAGSIAWASTHLPVIDQKAATLGLALDAYLQGTVRVTVGGTGDAARGLLKAASRLYAPGRVVARRESPQASASVCVGERCLDGIVDPDGLAAAAAELQSKAPRAAGSVAAP